ncbi:MAG: molybdopterin-dependent oxidoreductase [Rhodospirillaceae bacterium]|nr:molybdopterin-dependent oxidoreductase [Rhodospirillaceae bacterium]
MKPISNCLSIAPRILSAGLLAAWLALGLQVATAAAEDPILTVDGAISKGPSVTYTLAELDAMPQTEIKTATPWYDGVQTFSGPLLSHVLAAVGAQGADITAHALNDYSADLPAADAADFGVILATRINGEVLSIRDKGPIFIVYPYDSDAKLRHDIYYTRSVWQVDQLTLK